MAMNTSSEIDILWIHKKTFVKQSRFYSRLRAQEHKTAAQIRSVNRSRQVAVAQFVSAVASGNYPCGQEPATKHIHRRGQPFGQILLRSVRRNDTRH